VKKWFADANLFLRFFTQDDAGQSAAAKRLFQKSAAGEVLLVVGPPVLFEVAWTLRSAYRQPQEKIVNVLRAILGTAGIEVLDADVVEDALRRSEETGVEFADAYIMAASVAEGCEAIATFNRSDFVKLGANVANL
jgi:predicted nucleic-acid-binding protein